MHKKLPTIQIGIVILNGGSGEARSEEFVAENPSAAIYQHFSNRPFAPQQPVDASAHGPQGWTMGRRLCKLVYGMVP